MTDRADRIRSRADWVLLDHTPTAVLVVDRQGIIVLANAETEQLFGYGHDGLVDMDVETLVPEALRHEHRRAREHYHAAPRIRPMGKGMDLLGRKRDGTTFPVEIGLNFATVSGEQLVVAFISDITERKRREREYRLLEAKMANAQKMEGLGRLAGAVAHDFNNLLTCVLGNAELLGLETRLTARARASLEEIEHAVLRGTEITSLMIAYAGGGNFEFCQLDLSQIVRDFTGHLRDQHPGVTINVEPAENLPALAGDIGHMRHLIGTLVDNAVESLRDGKGTVTIKTDLIMVDRNYLAQAYVGSELADGPAICLEVSDNGSGMDAETCRRAFEPFFTTKTTGRGIGLSATLGIVRHHGGAIGIYSEPGLGTRVRIVFPAAGASPSPRATESGTVPAPRGRLLVIEDNDLLRQFVVRLLTAARFHVACARDGREGLRMFTEAPTEYGAVLLDTIMPHLTGPEVLREIRKLRPDVPVILMSGFSAPPDIEFDECTVFVEKPWLSDALVLKLDRLLAPKEGARTESAPTVTDHPSA